MMDCSHDYFSNADAGRGGMGGGMTSSPCRSCEHFGTPPEICIEYPDCPLNHPKEPIFSCQRNYEIKNNKKQVWTPPPKTCPACGELFYRKKECRASWAKKICCNQDCWLNYKIRRTAERDKEIIRLWMKKVPYAVIAKQYSLSPSAVGGIVSKERKRLGLGRRERL